MNSSRYMSLVQVCMTDCWWYVDVASWTNTSAVIACNTLGFHNKPDITYSMVTIPVTTLIAVAHVKCRGDELDFTECVMKPKQISVNHSITIDNNKDEATSGSGMEENGEDNNIGGSSRDTHVKGINEDHDGGSGDDKEEGSASGDVEFIARKHSNNPVQRKKVTTTIVTLSCEAAEPRKPQSECVEEDIELISHDTTSTRSGVVRICYNGKWSVLCSSSRYWTYTEAGVICKQLGYSGQGAIALNGGTLPSDNTDVVLSSRITCEDGHYYNPSLSSCNKYASCKRVGNCPVGKQLVSVECEEYCQDGDFKHTTAISHSNFFVVTAMVCQSRVWRPICDTDWNYEDATVLCKGSGHSEYGALPAQFPYIDARAHKLLEFNKNVPMSINCEGDEHDLSLCRNKSSSSRCLNDGVSAAVCLVNVFDKNDCETGSVRLLDTRIDKSVVGKGELQVCINNLWGRVGFSSMTEEAAVVICRNLGFNTTKPGIISSDLSMEPLFVPTISCNGNEKQLSECLQFPTPSILLDDSLHDGTKLVCANPPKIFSFTPLHAEIHLDDTRPNSRQIDYTCTVSGDLPITVNWYYQYYNSSTPKEKPIDSGDYRSLVILTEDLKPSKHGVHVQEIEMISSEVLTSSYQSKITIKELNISKNGHYICIASNAYGKDLKHGFLFISAKPTVSLSFNPSIGIHGHPMNVTCSVVSYYPKLSLNILKDDKLISEGLNCFNSTIKIANQEKYLYQLVCYSEYITINDEGVYTCEVSGTVTKYSTHYYQVQSFPIIHYLTQNRTIHATNLSVDQFVILNCSVFGRPRPLIQWYRRDSSTCGDHPTPQQILIEPSNQYNISYTTSSTDTSMYMSYLRVSIDTQSIGHNTETYTCYGLNSLGSIAQSTTISTNIVHAKPVQLSLSINTGDQPSVLAGDRVYLTCTITTSVNNFAVPFVINWEKDGHMTTSHMIDRSGSPIGGWSDTLVLHNVNRNDTGLYSCSITDGVVSELVELKVEEPLVVHLFNNSPQVSAGHMISYISVNKPGASCLCRITNMENTEINCSTGVVHFTDVWCKGPHEMIDFIVTASTEREVATIRRQFYPEFDSYCAVNLINDGLTINGTNVIVEFTGVGHSSKFLCHIHDDVWKKCSSPWIMSVPKPGYYDLQIKPMGRNCRRDKIVFKQTITVD